MYIITATGMISAPAQRGAGRPRPFVAILAIIFQFTQDGWLRNWDCGGEMSEFHLFSLGLIPRIKGAISALFLGIGRPSWTHVPDRGGMAPLRDPRFHSG